MCQAHAWHVPLSPKSGMFYLRKRQNFLVGGALSGDALRMSDQYISVQRSKYAHSLGIFPQSPQDHTRDIMRWVVLSVKGRSTIGSYGQCHREH